MSIENKGLTFLHGIRIKNVLIMPEFWRMVYLKIRNHLNLSRLWNQP